MFAHALSTHEASNEIDFYSAVDDVKQQGGDDEGSAADDAGAGMIGTLEFNSATYYRYAAINLDLLKADTHLGKLSSVDRKAVLRAFIEAVLTAVPGARKNSMNGSTLPMEVLGIRKEKGQPLQLVNAFDPPAKASGKGLARASLDKMKEHLATLEKTWGALGEPHWLTEESLPNFLDNLLSGDV